MDLKAGVKTIQLHTSIHEVVNEYINHWKERLPDRLEGFYLHGSIALDAYIPFSSDIDFVAMTTERLSSDEVHVLSEIHSLIESKYKPKLDGAFLTWEDLGISRADSGELLPYYNEGKIGYGSHFNAVTWWLLEKKGITILGPDIKAKQLNADAGKLTSYVMENMNSYWAGRVKRVEDSIDELVQMPQREIDEEIEWTVLGLLRQYYTVQKEDIISKTDAGEYGISNLPGEYHKIISEALHIRNNTGKSAYESNVQKIEESLRFSKFIIEHCNRNINQ
jgi:predicted nucleotidyltransferase